MMKGLFNYETAYRQYTRLCLQEFVDDNIQYAEIRPNFMDTNQLWTDKGERKISNSGIMELIIEEYTKFQTDHPRVFGGLKVIYCTPRSSSKEAVRYSLNECLAFKKRWPEWIAGKLNSGTISVDICLLFGCIAGYDIIGEENKGYPLKTFVPEFLEFKKKCADENVDIPFLFHCGETLDIGCDTDGNLVDAVLLGAKRIAHGFALPRHPYILEQMKKRNMCVELCPISNEILGLTPRVSGHAMYSMLANNLPCTLNTDNGTLFRFVARNRKQILPFLRLSLSRLTPAFRSRLSHDFYQTFVGKADMTLHGWRQLIEWSIEHSCMEDQLRKDIYADWERRWNEFCRWVVNEYGHLIVEGMPPKPLD